MEDALEYVDPPPTRSSLMEQWATTSQVTSLPEFLGDRTVRSITAFQVHLARPDATRRGWDLGGIALHVVELRSLSCWYRMPLTVDMFTGDFSRQRSIC
jgi:hypothetical protein